MKLRREKNGQSAGTELRGVYKAWAELLQNRLEPHSRVVHYRDLSGPEEMLALVDLLRNEKPC